MLTGTYHCCVKPVLISYQLKMFCYALYRKWNAMKNESQAQNGAIFHCGKRQRV